MTHADWHAVKDLFATARELADWDREVLLRRRAIAEPDTVTEVRRLLASDALSTDFLEPPDPAEMAEPIRRLSFDFRGLKLGEFELVDEIGRGASGVVYLGVQRSLGRKVAIKILAPHFAGTPTALRRFEREAMAASRVRHPAVVTVLAYGEQEGCVYLVMEHVPGKTLHQHLEACRLDPSGHVRDPDDGLDVHDPMTAARIALRVAEGLDSCHAHGVVHRDIKPANILIDREGSPRIVDFGVAKDQRHEGITADGFFAGTLHYMSPEQAEARSGLLDARTDIYSLGVVLYEMLTLQRPFDSLTSTELVRRVLSGNAVRAHHVDPSVPKGLSAICAKAMHRDPRERYASAAEMAADLRAFVEGRGIAVSARMRFEDAYRAVFVKHPWVPVAGALLLFGAIVIYPSRAGVEARDTAEAGGESKAVTGVGTFQMPPSPNDLDAWKQVADDIWSHDSIDDPGKTTLELANFAADLRDVVHLLDTEIAVILSPTHQAYTIPLPEWMSDEQMSRHGRAIMAMPLSRLSVYPSGQFDSPEAMLPLRQQVDEIRNAKPPGMIERLALFEARLRHSGDFTESSISVIMAPRHSPQSTPLPDGLTIEEKSDYLQAELIHRKSLAMSARSVSAKREADTHESDRSSQSLETK